MITKDDKQAAIERFGMRGMTIEALNSMVNDHKREKSFASRVIAQAAKDEIFVKRAIGAE